MKIKEFSAGFFLLQTIYESASAPLENNENNIHGWESVMLDPDEEGASKLVKIIGKSKIFKKLPISYLFLQIDYCILCR